MGAIHSSCMFNENHNNVLCKFYKKSEYANGTPQWLLRATDTLSPVSYVLPVKRKKYNNSDTEVDKGVTVEANAIFLCPTVSPTDGWFEGVDNRIGHMAIITGWERDKNFMSNNYKFDRNKLDWSCTRALMQKGMANSMLIGHTSTLQVSELYGVTPTTFLPQKFNINELYNNDYNNIPYGLRTLVLSGCTDIETYTRNSSDRQMLMYSYAMPYVDHAQYTIFGLDVNGDTLECNEMEMLSTLIIKTNLSKFKSGYAKLYEFKNKITFMTSQRLCSNQFYIKE